MAKSRPFTTIYSHSSVIGLNTGPVDGIGHSAKANNAIIAATRRILMGDYRRADVYGISGVRLYSITKPSPNQVLIRLVAGQNWGA